MSDSTINKAERDGFTQGVAWAVSILNRYPLGPGGLLKESGISLAEFKAARVVSGDLSELKKVFKLEGIRP